MIIILARADMVEERYTQQLEPAGHCFRLQSEKLVIRNSPRDVIFNHFTSIRPSFAHPADD